METVCPTGSISLMPIMTLTEELTIDSPYGFLTVDATKTGIWETTVEESVGFTGEFCENIFMVHETMLNPQEKPQLTLIKSDYRAQKVFYYFAHKDRSNKIDFCQIVVVEEKSQIH